ncbi:MAG TPA: hypothetical protein VFM70_04355 [Salinimicrobium sp.]|nr:hypothetical protein [Salinimicrobium sp.]
MKAFRPILFSTLMVEALIKLLKNQTRRIIKIPTNLTFKTLSTTNRLWDSTKEESPNPIKTEAVFQDTEGNEVRVKSKYQVGDVLWVRETWKFTGWSDEGDEMLVEYKDGVKQWCPIYDPHEDGMWLADQIDDLAAKGFLEPNDKTERYDVVKELHWKPSIFMPKVAPRIFLEVTNVRVERLQDISEDDAIAEGITDAAPLGFRYNGFSQFETAKLAFKHLWQSINGEESWKSNPWVWVYDLKKVEKPENFGSK